MDLDQALKPQKPPNALGHWLDFEALEPESTQPS